MRKQTKLVAVLSAAALLAIGASMTSFAATKGWVQEGEDWIYLDKDGEREANVWRRSGDNYYYLNEDGIMAKDTLIKDDTVNATYYVDENGVRLTNVWKEIPNDEGAQVGSQNSDDTPEVLYYYFGSAGKAYTAGDEKKVRDINGKYYMFNEEGQMLSGWQESTKGDLYYFGTEREGWAYTGWQKLEPNDYMQEEDYDELEWFYFGSTGKASKNKSQYIDGKYYHFNEDGIMDDDWYDSPATIPTAASAAKAFASVSGTLSSGWVYTGDADLPEDVRYDNDDMYWYYLVSVREGGKVARSIPYNYQLVNGSVADATSESGATGDVRAKVIKNKTYLFNSNGKMLKGFVVIKDAENIPTVSNEKDSLGYFGLGEAICKLDENDKPTRFLAYNWINETENAHDRKIVTNFAGADDPFAVVYKRDDNGNLVMNNNGKPVKTYAGIEGRTLLNGLYYFNEASGSVQGQMQTGRTAITKDGETYYYYFSKDSTYPGYAYTNAIQDGYLYGADGKCVVAEAGNSHMVYVLPHSVMIINKKDKDTGLPKTISAGSSVVVSRTGKVKTSGTITIDGVKYTIDSSNYTVDDSKTTVID